MTYDSRQILSDAREAALLAWQHIARYFRGEFRIYEKQGTGPATDADREADAFLMRWLGSRYPEAGFLTEESDENPDRLLRDLVWVIDPIDGTRDFIAGGPDFAVHVACVVRDSDGLWRPLATVVYEPVSGRLYTATRGSGAFLEEEGAVAGALWWQRTTENVDTIPFSAPARITASENDDLPSLHAIASKSRMSTRLCSALDAIPVSAVDRRGGMGVKAMEVATGRVDFYLQPELGRSSEWDLCAPHLIVEEAGGRVSDLGGQEVTYNREDIKLRGGVLVSNGSCHPPLLNVVGSLDLA